LYWWYCWLWKNELKKIKALLSSENFIPKELKEAAEKRLKQLEKELHATKEKQK